MLLDIGFVGTRIGTISIHTSNGRELVYGYCESKPDQEPLRNFFDFANAAEAVLDGISDKVDAAELAIHLSNAQTLLDKFRKSIRRK